MTNTENRFQSFITVLENSEVLIRDSQFSNCYSFNQGPVVSGGYQNAVIEIYNSNFTQNGAKKGGIFSVSDRSVVKCTSCILEDNFALSSGTISALSNGFFEFENTTLINNKATSVPISEIEDSAELSKFVKSTLSQNYILTKEKFL